MQKTSDLEIAVKLNINNFIKEMYLRDSRIKQLELLLIEAKNTILQLETKLNNKKS